MCVDSPDKPFRSSPYYSSEGNGCNKEDRAYQDTEGAPDERISMLGREDTGGLAGWLLTKETNPSAENPKARMTRLRLIDNVRSRAEVFI